MSSYLLSLKYKEIKLMFSTIPGAKVAPPHPYGASFFATFTTPGRFELQESQFLPEPGHAGGPLLVTTAEATTKPRLAEHRSH